MCSTQAIATAGIPRASGLSLALVGVCAMVVQLAVIGPFVKRFGERTALIAGLSFGTIGFMITGCRHLAPSRCSEFPSCRCGGSATRRPRP